MKEKAFQGLLTALFWNTVKKEYGIYKCVLGRRTHLCNRTDFNGPDKNDARQNYGSACMYRKCIGIS